MQRSTQPNGEGHRYGYNPTGSSALDRRLDYKHRGLDWKAEERAWREAGPEARAVWEEHRRAIPFSTEPARIGEVGGIYERPLSPEVEVKEVTNDWEKDPNGRVYRDSLGETGRSSLQPTLDDMHRGTIGLTEEASRKHAPGLLENTPCEARPGITQTLANAIEDFLAGKKVAEETPSIAEPSG